MGFKSRPITPGSAGAAEYRAGGGRRGGAVVSCAPWPWHLGASFFLGASARVFDVGPSSSSMVSMYGLYLCDVVLFVCYVWFSVVVLLYCLLSISFALCHHQFRYVPIHLCN